MKTRKGRRRRRTRRRPTTRKKKTFTKQDYNSGDGMLTSVWGPGLWHYLHTMSFNYPVHPTSEQKKQYKAFILGLQHVLPCKHCRENLKKNLRYAPLRACDLDSREGFSRYIYNLHETVNRLLGKKSGLTYDEVRDRYENFRSRCTADKPRVLTRKTLKREKGCTVPLYGKKAKSIIKIVPADDPSRSLQIDQQCIKKRAR